MKFHEIYSHFNAMVNAWWEWFLTTIIDVDPTEFIAVGNRSHKIFKLFPGTKKSSSSIRLTISADSGGADT